MTCFLTRALIVGAACLSIVAAPRPGAANPGPIAEVLCAPTETMRDRLERRFRASRSWQGLRSPDQIVELWEDDQGDWTLVIAYAGGKVCIVAMGTRLTGFPDAAQRW